MAHGRNLWMQINDFEESIDSGEKNSGVIKKNGNSNVKN